MTDGTLPITVNICTFNEQTNIATCLNSVFKNRPAEVIVIDGGSTDKTVEIAKSFSNVRVITSRTKGLAGQRKIGLENSKYQFIAIIDADDVIEDNFLGKLLSDLNKHRFDAIQGREIAYVPENYWEKAMGYTNTQITFSDKPVETNMVGRPSLYRKTALDKCGFDLFFNGVGCEDLDLSIRMEKHGFIQGLGTGLTRRKQSGSFSEIFKKFKKYGKGDAHIIVKYPEKFTSIIFHQLIRYPILKPFHAIFNGGIMYIPFFIFGGLTRFIYMILFYNSSKKKGKQFGY